MAFILALAGAVVGVAGSAMASEASIKAGKRADELNREKAKAVKAEAGEAMLAEREQKERIVSRATALAAAGGGSVSDPTTQKILGNLEGEGQYRELLQLYRGEREAKLLTEQGKALKQEGRDRANAYAAQGIASALQGVSSAYSQYNQSRINNVPGTQQARNGVMPVIRTQRTYTPARFG